MKLPIYQWFIYIALLIVGFCGGYAIAIYGAEESVPIDVREFNTKYHYINPLLACGDENFSGLQNDATNSLRNSLEELIQKKENESSVVDGAVYIRPFNGGPWLGINYETMFTPGSLLKVPLIMSVYKHAEREPGFLEKKILFEGGAVPAVEYFSSIEIHPGQTYSVEDLVKAVLIDSDNNAAVLLTQLISHDELRDSYSQLGIEEPAFGEDYSMTVRTYASFFRILYNATYIDHDASEHLLAVLGQATFDKGLVAGVPNGVVVAHKFGERQLQGQEGVQLHDCGIVYAKNPYLICVMLRGSNLDTLAGVIAEISKKVYESVAAKK